MDIIFHIIELIVKAMLEGDKPKQSPRPPVQPRAQAGTLQRPPLYRSQSGTPPVSSRVTPTRSDPVYDDEGWRRAATVLAVIVFIVMVVAWFLLTQGQA